MKGYRSRLKKVGGNGQVRENRVSTYACTKCELEKRGGSEYLAWRIATAKLIQWYIYT